ncbi:MAG TPA: hypothetical protein VFQ38_08650 [Longimicrobiales bacterium]|nr:hypothetical protein [Longimicrobiales bacterium]
MPAPLPDSHLDRAFYRLGYLLEELSQHGDGKASAAGPADELRRVAVAAALTGVLRPRKVGWSRLLAATLVGHMIGEALTGFGMDGLTDEELDARLREELEAEEAALRGHEEAGEGEYADIYAAQGVAEEHGYDTELAGDELAAEEAVLDMVEDAEAAAALEAELAGAEAPGASEALAEEDEREERALQHVAAEAGRALAQRAAADLATAAAYAALVYPRLPGPALLKGLAFGVLDAGTGTGGGAVGVLRGLAPRVRFPLARLHPAGTERAATRALALGLALGLLYRAPGENDGA